MGKVFAVANQKGGVGKSTTVVNLAAYLGSRGKTVLCIDIDAQGNCTTGLGIKKKSIDYSSYDVITGQIRIQEAVVRTEFKNVSIIPATSALAGAEIEMIDIDDRMNRLKMQLLTCRLDYDYILIDCPPSLNLITLNALIACDSVIVPMQAEFFALEGLSQLMETIKIVRTKFNSSLEIEGVLFTMFDPRLNVSGQVVEEVEKYLPGKVFETKIPRNVRLSEAPSYGQPVMYYDKNSKGAESYELLGHEILKEKLTVKKQKKNLFKRKK